MEGKLLLIGHDEGLSVLDMYPRSEAAAGISIKGPEEAQARSIWTGEGYGVFTVLSCLLMTYSHQGISDVPT